MFEYPKKISLGKFFSSWKGSGEKYFLNCDKSQHELELPLEKAVIRQSLKEIKNNQHLVYRIPPPTIIYFLHGEIGNLNKYLNILAISKPLAYISLKSVYLNPIEIFIDIYRIWKRIGRLSVYLVNVLILMYPAVFQWTPRIFFCFMVFYHNTR